MSYQFNSIMDHPYFYRTMALVWYLFYLSNAFLAFNRGKIPVLPNITLTVISILAITYLTSVATQIEVVEHTNRWIIIRMLLALIPPLLAMFITFGWIKRQREEGATFFQYAGPLFLAIVLSYMTFLFLIVGIIFFTADVIPFHVLYLMTLLFFWSMIGFTIGDKLKVTHMKKDNIIINTIRKTMVDRVIRIRLTVVLSALVVVLIMFTSAVNYPPVDIDYQVSDENYIGDIAIIKDIELQGNKYSINDGYNGSDAPIIISRTIIDKTRELAINNYGSFEYIAVLAAVNDTLTNLLSGNVTIFYNNTIATDLILDDFSSNTSYLLLTQYLVDPFNYGKSVRSVVIVLDGEAIAYITTNSGWETLKPAFNSI